MNENFKFERVERGMDFAGMTCSATGSIAAVWQGMTTEDVIYRVATIIAVLFLLVTML